MQTGQKIASLRKKAELSQEQLAEKLFVSRELVSKWETGKRLPDKRMTVQLSELFNVPVEDLYDSKNNSCEELLSCFSENVELADNELSQIINMFLKKISETERTIFISRYYYGHNSEQTAAETGLRSGYIRKKLSLIRKKLKEFVKEFCYG